MRLVVLLFIATVLHVARPAHAAVLTGIDVLADRGFDLLEGKRVGLITNHTGRNVAGVSIIDVLANAPGVELVALFSPEHGIRGEADRKLASSTDSATGLPIHSLYGVTCRPTKEMLAGIDVLIFDIQDIGTRFYTYIGTMSLAMSAAADAGIPFVVLDRPNPIGGIAVEGAVPEMAKPSASGCSELTSIHPIPTRHGMTVGELALMFNTEHAMGADLAVVRMEGWQRWMYYDDTGLKWVDPSPNMRSLQAALLYPGPGTLETSNLSVGRGTGTPFEIYGAPWVDQAALMANLKARSLPGVAFTPCEFKPAGPHPYAGQTCFGVRVSATDRDQFDPVLTGLHLAQAFHRTRPEKFRTKRGFAIEVGDRTAWKRLTEQENGPEELAEQWRERVEEFQATRQQYLLY